MHKNDLKSVKSYLASGAALTAVSTTVGEIIYNQAVSPGFLMDGLALGAMSPIALASTVVAGGISGGVVGKMVDVFHCGAKALNFKNFTFKTATPKEHTQAFNGITLGCLAGGAFGLVAALASGLRPTLADEMRNTFTIHFNDTKHATTSQAKPDTVAPANQKTYQWQDALRLKQ